jgi:uncharacterized protein (TIGR02246 family)
LAAAAVGERGARASPEATAREFAAALSAGDAVAAAALFAPHGRMLTGDRTEVSGRAAIESLLGQVVESRIALEIRVGRTLRAGDVALCTQYWRRRWRADGDGHAFDHSTVASLVLGLRRERWEVVIVSPWG